MKIHTDARVQIHYRLLDTDGELLETTDPEEPIVYTHGDEEILSGLEKALEGHEAGEEIRVELSPEDAYGDYNPEGLIFVPRSDLPEDLELTAGEWISVGVEDTDESGEEETEMEMRVVKVHDKEVVLDANHPLAGKRVVFEVQVVSVGPS